MKKGYCQRNADKTVQAENPIVLQSQGIQSEAEDGNGKRYKYNPRQKEPDECEYNGIHACADDLTCDLNRTEKRYAADQTDNTEYFVS